MGRALATGDREGKGDALGVDETLTGSRAGRDAGDAVGRSSDGDHLTELEIGRSRQDPVGLAPERHDLRGGRRIVGADHGRQP